MFLLARSTVLFVVVVLAANASAATVELLSGNSIECKVLARDSKNVTVEVMMGGMPVKRVIPLTSVHKVTINGKEYLINDRPTVKAKSVAAPARATSTSAATASGILDGEGSSRDEGLELRTKSEVEALIKQQGREPPDWFETTPFNPPKTLDLEWPEKPGEGWNNQKNVGQYIWDIINPNPSKWREGVRLLHDLLSRHADDMEKRTRIMNSLGVMYHNLHQDYARAAFWWRQAGVDKPNSRFSNNSIHLAECYWRLGNKQMAVEHLRKAPLAYPAIKLWADMGETDEAVKLAERIAKLKNAAADVCYLYAGDGHRTAGRYSAAIQYYEKVLLVPAKDPGKGRIDRNHARARASIEAIQLFELSDVSQVADGTYTAESIGYEGPVHVEVQLQGGRIEAVRVTQHREKQFYSAMTDTPNKILAKQGVKGVDATSSATITSEAIINATAKALASGAKQP